jgi:hypothetical protein
LSIQLLDLAAAFCPGPLTSVARIEPERNRQECNRQSGKPDFLSAFVAGRKQKAGRLPGLLHL